MTESARPGRRRKAALDSRIVASGLAACAAFGMVLGMAVGEAPEAAAVLPPTSVAPVGPVQPAPPRPEVIIIQRRYVPVGGSTGGAGSSVSTSSSTSTGSVAPAPALAPAPAPPPTSSGGS